MKITVLMENTAPEGCGLTPEHGLSLYIEYRDRVLLLDTGASGKFADNAQVLGVDLSAVEAAVLSHGHFDHGDGLRRFFQCNSRAPVYVRPGAAGAYFGAGPEGPRYIGVHRALWREYQNRFVEITGLYSLAEGVWLAGKTVHDPVFAGQAADLLFKRGEDDFIPDDYRHEQSLVLEGERGLVVLNSCSHGGIVNIVRSVLDQFPGKRGLCCGGRLSHVRQGRERDELHPGICLPGGRRFARAGCGAALHWALHWRARLRSASELLRAPMQRPVHRTEFEFLIDQC